MTPDAKGEDRIGAKGEKNIKRARQLLPETKCLEPP